MVEDKTLIGIDIQARIAKMLPIAIATSPASIIAQVVWIVLLVTTVSPSFSLFDSSMMSEVAFENLAERPTKTGAQLRMYASPALALSLFLPRRIASAQDSSTVLSTALLNSTYSAA